MLVKLGDIWVDPLEVSVIGPNDNNILTVIVNGDRHYPKEVSLDECVSTINSAVGQTFGGENEKTPSET